MEQELPCISILTPIFNRTKWKQLMIFNLVNLDYPKDKLEWVIYDSHDKKNEQWDKLFKSEKEIKDVEEQTGVKINYQFNPNSFEIGVKRNKLVKMAKYKICANADSDDVMLPTWLKHSIDVMKSDKRCSFVGCPAMTFCFPHLDYKITGICCPEKRMIHESASVFTKKHHKQMGGYQKSSCGEGTNMIDFAENMCLKTEADQCIICICHEGNTIDKSRFADKSDKHIVLGGPIRKIIEKII